MITKLCSRCRIEKTVDNFGKCKSSKDGFLYCCKECNNKRGKKHREKNYEKILEYQRNWRRKNKDIVKKRNHKNYINNIEYNSNRVKVWFKNNPEKKKLYRINYKERAKEVKKIRIKNDPIFAITNNLRARIFKFLRPKNIKKTNKTFDIVGCTPEFLKEHLEKQFVDGMNWDNKGEWHIDHIIPLSSAKNKEELYKLSHYSNLQPLWAEDNMKKSNKIL